VLLFLPGILRVYVYVCVCIWKRGMNELMMSKVSRACYNDECV